MLSLNKLLLIFAINSLFSNLNLGAKIKLETKGSHSKEKALFKKMIKCINLSKKVNT